MYLVDGHNLIGKIPTLSLSDLDDEEALIGLLNRYALVKRRREMVVFFDKAAPGRAGSRQVGGIRVVSVHASTTADEAIRRQLVELGKRARNATVITSDRAVQANARALHAAVIDAETFAAELMALPAPSPARKGRVAGKNPQLATPPVVNVDEWYDLFQIDPASANDDIHPGPPTRPPKRKGKKK